jgi:hypothetical protein
VNARDRTEALRRGWLAVERADRDGERCGDCPLCWRSSTAADEPSSRECSLLYTGDGEPADCPAVDMQDIADDMAAESEEASQG